MSSWEYSCLTVLVFCLVFRGGVKTWMLRNAVLIGSGQMLRGSRSPIICGGAY